MPPGFTPLAIGEDYLVGMSLNLDDVPNVSVFDLDRRRGRILDQEGEEKENPLREGGSP